MKNSVRLCQIHVVSTFSRRRWHFGSMHEADHCIFWVWWWRVVGESVNDSVKEILDL